VDNIHDLLENLKTQKDEKIKKELEEVRRELDKFG